MAMHPIAVKQRLAMEYASATFGEEALDKYFLVLGSSSHWRFSFCERNTAIESYVMCIT